MATQKEQRLKILNAKKEQYFAGLQRLYDNSRDISTTEKVAYFKMRYASLSETKSKLLAVVDEINLLQCELDEEFVPNFKLIETIDDLVCRIEYVAIKVIDSYSTRPTPVSTVRQDRKSIRKLPEMPLPKFSGDSKEWPRFIECYNSMIHNNPDLSDVNRVHYLLGCLTDNALSVCSGIAPTGENYRIILNALIDKYEDKRSIANSLLDQLLTFKQSSTENVQSLDSFLEKFDPAVTALRKIDIPDLADYIFAYLALQKLNPETQRLLENTRRNVEMPSYNDIIIFIKEQAKICSRTSSVETKTFNSHAKGCGDHDNIGGCLACPKFLEKTPEERYKITRSNNLCLNCLAFHKIINCKSNYSCRICNLKHHTLLHFQRQVESKPSDSKLEIAITDSSLRNTHSPISSGTSSDSANSSSLNCYSITPNNDICNSTVLLSTAKVNVLDVFGNLHEGRFLMDSGSHANFLTLEFSRRLKLRPSICQTTVLEIGSNRSFVHGRASTVCISKINAAQRFTLDVLVVDKIADQLPTSQVDLSVLTYIKKVPLADDEFHVPGKVDGIIGAHLFAQLLGSQRITGPPNTPLAIETKLGYVLMGCAPVVSPIDNLHSFFLTTDSSLETLLKRFWELEDVPALTFENPEDIECENFFKSTYKREANGRYTVALPFQIDSSFLGDSYATTHRRFLSLEKRLEKDETLRIQYSSIIQDYLTQGHMSKVMEHSPIEPNYFIPHHAIFKPGSSTTPVRIVFDASCKTTSLYSLNDILFTGPKVQSDICTMLLNFRLFQVALSADIRQMYRQIDIRTDHRNFQKILWRFSPLEPIEVYRLNTVTFGVKCSPFLALRTLRQLANDEESSFPLASQIVRRDMYVDDLVTSIPSPSVAIKLYSELKELFSRGGFQLLKWATNSSALREYIPTEDSITSPIYFENDSLKVLGLEWNPTSDFLSFSFTIMSRACTKRNILSTIARCYDPLGFLEPVTLLLKLLVKECWTLQLDWDTPCPPKFKIPRYIGVTLNQPVVIVGFADACLTSYGAVVYLVSMGDRTQGHHLVAKTKVSPVKVVTIPKLELYIRKLYALSDSSVALSWIATCPSKLPIFIANRVVQIRSQLDLSSWYHVNGKDNISDCLSRGLTPYQFINNRCWASGPEWLKMDVSKWPIRTVHAKENQSEMKLSLVASQGQENPFYSLIARCSKWIISVLDLRTAELALIKLIQRKHFSSEFALLTKGILPPSLRHLRPFLNDNLIRVGGRLSNSDSEFDVQHPILLPKREHLVDLLIDHYHQLNLHTGPHLVLSLLRQRYWILAARGIIRRRIQNCNTCFRLKPKPQIPIMGDLPACRVRQAKAFLHTGCDYAGPISIIPYRRRGVRPIKAYICLFVCMATKAVHLELVTSLSTDHFLQAFKRFLSRRGVVIEIHSDNGTNFIGARACLNELYKFILSPEYNDAVRNELAKREIQWKLIPPSAPHMGGLSVGSKLQIECVLNSRPLCVLSSDPSEPTILTPAHFLTLGPLTHFPAYDYSNINISRLDRFQLIDRMIHDFWKRWKLEYLTTLQVRSQWNTEHNPVQIGTIVVVEQPNTPPLQWPLGIIEKVYPGKDQVVRVVDVRTKYGTYRRPVIKVCPLPSQ
ncbi:uncharacterized protein LOC116162080 [Photinus pyralis]|uniref:uncharacterized protein LOC116162080 n=1 Tax=Photinus pyralis TaxID=7054 RepID=UPI0012675A71|nr:uncharacterized protein LOC116162080 [Photinus pyralis]